ncbi:MAG: nucleotidyltransferase domain-containing protein [Clostridiales bacterium]|nr:nucleotidyltransferase domain-containing protein [Clostridiales bacterium]
MKRIYSIDEIKSRLLPVFSAAPIEKAIIFGSYAKGNPKRSSDVDIVIDSGGKIRGIDFFGVLEDIVEILDIPVDLIEASQIINGSHVENEFLETGIVIYERI